MVLRVVVFADAGDEEPVGLHGGEGLVREPAGLRPGARPADPAAAAAQAQGSRILLPQIIAKFMKRFHMIWVHMKK